MQIGRAEIFTDYDEINEENIISVLQDAFAQHYTNSNRIDYLLNFDAGVQPQIRQKLVRPDIDIAVVDNVAHEAVAFNEAYHWGNPITWVQRGVTDTGTVDEATAIALLNEQYSGDNVESKTQQNGRYIEICGVSYIFIDVNARNWQEGDSYFTYEVLDPRYSFIVKSSKLGHKKMLGVTYSMDSAGTKYITAFTEFQRFEIIGDKIVNGKKNQPKSVWYKQERSGEINPLGLIPIVECIRSYDRMGCFEREIDDMLALNLLESDIVNNTDECVQAIWHCNDVDFPVEIVKDADGNDVEVPVKPGHNDWLQTYTTKEGKTPFVTPLSTNFDYAGNLNYVNQKRSYILEKLCVPQRNTTSGGSTGVAMDSATGWNAAENLANAVENIAVGWKMEELRVVLKAIQNHPHIAEDSPLLTLKPMDVKPSIKRNKSYELSVKSNFVSTMLKAGVYGEHVLAVANIFPDPHQVWLDSKETMEAIQRKLYETNSSPTEEVVPASDDVINQVGNSPLIDQNRG